MDKESLTASASRRVGKMFPCVRIARKVGVFGIMRVTVTAERAEIGRKAYGGAYRRRVSEF